MEDNTRWRRTLHGFLPAGYVIVIIMCLLLINVSHAAAWWDDHWKYRMKISFDTTPAGGDIKENLVETPVLIRLHTANFNFSNCKENAEDIRFVAGDDKTVLKYHLERFDTLDQVAFLWVKVNRLTGASKQDSIWMYYGNPAATDGQDSGGTYDANQVVVYHFNEVKETPKDASARQNNPSVFSGGQGFPGVIGNGLTFNGAGDKIVIPSSPTLDFSGGFTFSAWIRITTPLADGYVFSQEEGEKSIILRVDQTTLSCRVQTEAKQVFTTEKVIDVPLNSWHHVAVTVASKGRLSLFFDGIGVVGTDFSAQLPGMKSAVVLGSSFQGEHFFMGDMDEIQISNSARSADWIKAAAKAQGVDSSLLSYGKEEAGGGSDSGMPVFYFDVILKNVSLEGWIINGFLLILAAGSWFIFLTKVFSLRDIDQENKAFWDAYNQTDNLFALENDNEEFANSALYMVYKSGCQYLNTWMTSAATLPQEKTILPPQAMDAFKSALERGFVGETKRLNARVVVFLMGISGGPLIGLLGTVWGVMNTFAAMAKAGEANIMVIAPGIASALTGTLCGLLVGIPSLFIYNYLVVCVRNITLDMSVFMDQFTHKVINSFGSTR